MIQKFVVSLHCQIEREALSYIKQLKKKQHYENNWKW